MKWGSDMDENMTETERQLLAQAMDEICAEINEEIRRLEEDDQG
jgi:hypothetical protein